MTTFSIDSDMLATAICGAPDAEILALEARLRRAQLAADTVELDVLISDQLLFTGPDGLLASKAQDLDAHASGAVRFRSHEPEELQIRRVGRDCAVVALRARLCVDVMGATHSGTYRYTRVWSRSAAGAWQVIGGHVSEVTAAAN